MFFITPGGKAIRGKLIKFFEYFIFGGKDLTKFSLLDHESVPKHEIMSEGELKSVLSKYSIEKEQLPKIKVQDPVSKEIGAVVGDVVKITRKSQTAGEAEYYRLVIE
jgi:DNA-directed RNA polymerase subunit H